MKDRNQIVGVLLIVCAIFLMFNIGQRQQESFKTTANNIVLSENQEHEIQQPATLGHEISSEQKQEATIINLHNDVIDISLSNAGGTIHNAALKKYPAHQDSDQPIVFNDGSNMNALAYATGKWDVKKFQQSVIFDIIAKDDNRVIFSKKFPEGYVVTREYSIPQHDSTTTDGYVISHTTTIENVSSNKLSFGDIYILLGTMPASESDILGEHLSFGYFNGNKDHFVSSPDFKARNGIFGMGKREAKEYIVSHEPTQWGAIKNQFFATIFTPRSPADGCVSFPVTLLDDNNKEIDGIAGALLFEPDILMPGEKITITSDMYIGPKNFSRLSSMHNEQGRVMQFGFFGAISELLLRLMLKIHAVIPNWGWTIIVLTTLVKLLLWPLTNAQVRSSKKMAAVQQPLKILKEKYKNNPQKLQAETLKLFKANSINPAAGCLPIFIQIPIFFGLYYMLRTASDLRFAHFLWIQDLSMPDTIGHIGHFQINLLPIIMGITMFWQMHMTPMPTADKSQKLMFKLMPAIFLLCCYQFPSGLVLYWTVQNLLTIIQQWIVVRKHEPLTIIEDSISKVTKHTKNTKPRKNGDKKNVRA